MKGTIPVPNLQQVGNTSLGSLQKMENEEEVELECRAAGWETLVVGRGRLRVTRGPGGEAGFLELATPSGLRMEASRPATVG